MARGKTVDSDTFGSGPHGGRGRGRSTRGQGGTIPPSSSSMSRASSFAQPPMPPSLPSVPFSSAPIPRPVESSPASQSPTVPEPRNKTQFGADYIYPSSRASRQNMRIIKLHPDKDGYTWDAIPQEARDFYWIRKSGKKQQCVSQEIWESWQKAWEDSAFMRKREIFAQNRRSETGGDGAGPSRQTGGSIFAIETSRLLVSQLV
ncbi:uncharacterized protein LOC105629783 [Jatropha curcas]|uniref:uncharacterized protein LOC105629783 n=1 Tax=Jatropha curcas TaxID=180498 RepID=UPI001895814D|nr:uncharacterized protein LOC105629783 [Jatropha curcas]